MRTLRNYSKHQGNQKTLFGCQGKKERGVHNCHYKFIINHSKYLVSKGRMVSESQEYNNKMISYI